MIEGKLLSRLVDDLRPARIYLAWGAILYIPITLLGVLQPLIIGYAVQRGMIDGSLTSILVIAIIFLGAVALLGICELAQGMCLQVAGQLLVRDLRQRAFLKVQRLPMSFLDSMPMGRILTRLTGDAEAVAELFSMGAVQIVGDGLFLVGTFIMLFFLDIDLSLYAAFVLPMLMIFMFFFRRWTTAAFVRVRRVLSDLNSFLQEYLSGIATVQTSGRLEKMHENFGLHNSLFMSANRQAIFLDAASYSLVDALSYLASAMVLWGAFNLKLKHSLSLGILVAFLEALSRFFQPVRELANRYSILQSALVSLDRIYQLFDWPEEIDGSRKEAIKFNGQIEFRHVSFSYKNGEPVLRDISFILRRGECVALVGYTGAGKSTVIKLLNRFYRCTNGAILIDGQDINDISLSELRKLISVVPQEVFMFKGTLRANLSFGERTVSAEDLWHALDVVQLSSVVRKRGGLDLEVAARGQNFSLGERQLLALARALVTDPPILVLDEATASVDAITEHRLQMATRTLLKRRTAIVIAHRLSTIMDADRILVFHNGQIVQEGIHEVLMREEGIYSNYIRLQQLI